MNNPLFITIVFVALVTLVGAFVRRRSRDKCLKSFVGFDVVIENVGGKQVWGRLRLENTGLELLYCSPHKDCDGHLETSYILYKQEYSNMQAVIRYHDQLDERGRNRRDKELARTYHPRLLRRLGRRIKNIFKTIRDSIIEVINVLLSQVKKTTPAGSMLTSQDKYVNQMKNELISSVATSYEPLLERHIGHKVVLELIKGDKLLEIEGILKDYTSEFVELLDVNYSISAEEAPRRADLVVLRKYGIIRHLAE
ncbi:hypothetical protein SMSP2_02245 [Limihaloglobus sulfuriphilus]|uniref:Uncharacterized protein n=1 Tax=Limihaloglobus sulfuriphilus TaxID=1851148 RepID=A0A1R7T5W0_9BACT|nr:hypothetical protein [Limihaloglobus sulfuriphilus]AQQ71866.1 hypothetical protein SMSP2_02245 [Limihaloglobus sulfuriphilus]